MVSREQVRESIRKRFRVARQKQEAKDKKVTDLEARVKVLEDKAG